MVLTSKWWSWAGLLRVVGRPRRWTFAPAMEPMESIALMSVVAPRLAAAHAEALRHARREAPVVATNPATAPAAASDVASAPQTLPVQTLTLPTTLTNIQNQPLSPSLALFNPALGTLSSVTVAQSVTFLSDISAQNLDPNASATITATLSGSYQIDGLSQTINGPIRSVSSQPLTAGPFGSSNDTVNFPQLQLEQSSTATYTDAADLAFYTATSARSSIAPTMSATGQGFSTSSSSNLLRNNTTTASATVAITYTYIPAVAPAVACPTVGKIGRIGVHHQRTLLVVPFQGVVDPSRAADRADYLVIARDGRRIPVISATYNPATNSVTLRPSIRLNVHHHDTLRMTLPCANGDTNVVDVRFGSKYSLIGFHDHQGKFVPVRNGHIVHFTGRLATRHPRHS